MKIICLAAVALAIGCSAGASDPPVDTSIDLVQVQSCDSAPDTQALCPAYGDTVVTCAADSVAEPADSLCWGPFNAGLPSVWCCHRKPPAPTSCALSAPQPGVCPSGYDNLSTCNYPTGPEGGWCVAPIPDQGKKRGFIWCCK